MKHFLFAATLLALWQAMLPAQDQSYTVHRAAQPLSLQSTAESAWKGAQEVTWGPDDYTTTFRALWTQDALWLRFDVEDPSPWNTMTDRDDKIWEEEVVEIFIDPEGAGKRYTEYELNPANVICDLDIAYNNGIKGNIEWNHEGIDSAVHKKPASGEFRGGWTGILVLPWKGFQNFDPVKEGRAAVPPKPGDTWRANLYRIERPGGPSEPRKDGVFAAWSPTGRSSFHYPPAFRPFRFAE